MVATTKAFNICRPATEALIQLLGTVRDESVDNDVKGKGRAVELDETDGSLGLKPIYPAIRAQPLFVQAVIKRIDSSDVVMAARRCATGLTEVEQCKLSGSRCRYQSRTSEQSLSGVPTHALRRRFA